MKAFEFDHRLIDAYARFSRSFSTIRSEDLKSKIDRQYDAGRFWPDALLSINPRFLQGPTVDDLVVSGDPDEGGQVHLSVPRAKVGAKEDRGIPACRTRPWNERLDRPCQGRATFR